MTADQILMKTAGPKYVQTRAAIAALLHTQPDQFRLLQFNNTLFLVHRLNPDTISVHIETLDSPQALASSFKQFAHSMQTSGIRQIVTTITNPQIIRLVQMLGYPISQQGGHTIIPLNRRTQ